MSSQTATDHHPARTYAAVLAAMAVAAAAGFWMSLTSRDMPGTRGTHPRGWRRRRGHHALRGARRRPGGQGPRGRTGPGAGPDGLDDRAGLLPARGSPTRSPAASADPPAAARILNIAASRRSWSRSSCSPCRHSSSSPPDGCPPAAGAGPPAPGSPAAGRPCSRSCSLPARSTRTCPRGATTRSGSMLLPTAGRRPRGGRDGAARRAAWWPGWPPSSPAGCATADHDGDRWRGSRSASSCRSPAWLTDTNGNSVVVEVLMALAIFVAMLLGIGWPLLGPLGSAVEASDQVASPRAEAEQSTGMVSSP